MLVFLLIWGGITGLIFCIGYEAMKEGTGWAAALCYVISAGMVVGGFYMIRKKYRENNTEE